MGGEVGEAAVGLHAGRIVGVGPGQAGTLGSWGFRIVPDEFLRWRKVHVDSYQRGWRPSLAERFGGAPPADL